MAKKTKQIPTVRVDEQLYQLVQQVALCNELNVAEVVRLALEDYCAPGLWGFSEPSVIVPIMGTISEKGINWNSSEVTR